MFLASLLVPTLLIQGGTIIDGSGGVPYLSDLRVKNGRIVTIGKLKQLPGETIISAKGLVVAPGFIDAHSHALGGIESEPTALSQLTQGITTAVAGQDGGWSDPVEIEFNNLTMAKPSINFAMFSGHGGIRRRVMGEDYKRPATPEEILKMKALVEADMKAGALGLSSGLEYDPGYYSNTSELVDLAKVASKYGGTYISHVRDEADRAKDAFLEVATIKQKANIPSQISHIKLGSKTVWGQAEDTLKLIDKYGLTADIYPYSYWQSTIAALSPSRDWENDTIWVKALDDVGGPQNVRLSRYSPNSAWEGRTLTEISALTGKSVIKLIQEILRTTNEEGRQSVVVTAMQESDMVKFIRHPRIMFCSDGSIGGSHPRGAGSFPRILSRYVREQKVISLPEAIRKMTKLPAETLKLSQRGEIRRGYIADLVIFDPTRIQDHATPQNSTALSTGVRDVIVNGTVTLRNSTLTGSRAGEVIRR